VQRNVVTQESSLKLARTRYQEGETGERDVQQALSELSDTEAQVPQLEVGAAQARHALAVLIGLPPAELGDRLGTSSRIPDSPRVVPAGIPADLLRRRPDVRAAEQNAAVESAKIGATKAELYPAFSLSGSFGYLSSQNGDLKLGDLAQWSSRT